jgi:uncharacterized protein YidB (DUF937 family)
MSFFDNLTQMAGLAGAGELGQESRSGLLQGVLGMLSSSGSGGGLAGVVQQFQQQGLGQLVSSWVSTGQNLPASADQITQGLGAGRLQELAQMAGLSEGATANALTSLLPTIIDKLTPNGQVPQAGGIDQLIGSVKGLFGG